MKAWDIVVSVADRGLVFMLLTDFRNNKVFKRQKCMLVTAIQVNSFPKTLRTLEEWRTLENNAFINNILRSQKVKHISWNSVVNNLGCTKIQKTGITATAMTLMKKLKHKSCEEKLRGLGLSRLEKRRFRGHFTALYNYMGLDNSPK